jgi:hypothetical protein
MKKKNLLTAALTTLFGENNTGKGVTGSSGKQQSSNMQQRK